MRHITFVLFSMAVATLPAFADKDVPGSKDHPLVTRYPGSVIYQYVTHDFDEYKLPIGKVEKDAPKSQRLEGRITRIVYTNPPNRSALEIYRNYEGALKRAGLQTIFECAGDACGLARWNMTGDWADMWNGGTTRELSGKLSRAEGTVYVNLHANQGWVWLDFIEPKAMQGGLVTVNAAALAGDITQSGHAAVYGIYFDTGKTDIKPESEPALAEIAKLIQQHPGLKIFVVGHTDNVGALAMNMDLSKRRAESVVRALTGTHRVPSDRLQAFGSGPLSPVASNRSEEGRAKNRRVELVEQ
jgi:outer membrane protein OmpA-like peptidoglycan-associated protein